MREAFDRYIIAFDRYIMDRYILVMHPFQRLSC